MGKITKLFGHFFLERCWWSNQIQWSTVCLAMR